jgi:hypothetical protein
MGPNILQRCIVKVTNGQIVCIYIPSLILRRGQVFCSRLFPGMSWGLSTVVLSSKELYPETKPVYFLCLPLLGVQRHIELPWHTLPQAFQEIRLPNFALLSLAAKLQLIQCMWGFHNAASMSLAMGYKSFMMELGFYKNPFCYHYHLFS